MRTTDSRDDTIADTRPHSPERTDSLDAALDALSDRRCRSLLGLLADTDEEAVLVSDLATQLADDESADEVRLRARLHHTLLPKLEDADLLEYDADRELVRGRANSAFDAVRSAVEGYEEAHPDALAVDVVFDLLSAYRRRTAYRVLLRHGDLSLPDLADEVAVQELGEPLPEVDPDRVLQVYLSLYHTHVPKLSEAGLVAYDQENDYVALTETGLALESAIGRLVEAADA